MEEKKLRCDLKKKTFSCKTNKCYSQSKIKIKNRARFVTAFALCVKLNFFVLYCFNSYQRIIPRLSYSLLNNCMFRPETENIKRYFHVQNSHFSLFMDPSILGHLGHDNRYKIVTYAPQVNFFLHCRLFGHIMLTCEYLNCAVLRKAKHKIKNLS